MTVDSGAERVRFENVRLESGTGRFEASLTIDGDSVGAWHVDVVRRQEIVSIAARGARQRLHDSERPQLFLQVGPDQPLVDSGEFSIRRR